MVIPLQCHGLEPSQSISMLGVSSVRSAGFMLGLMNITCFPAFTANFLPHVSSVEYSLGVIVSLSLLCGRHVGHKQDEA